MSERRKPQQNNDGGAKDHARAQNGARKDLRKPGNLDFKKAKEGLKEIVRENQEWLKEMASR